MLDKIHADFSAATVPQVVDAIQRAVAESVKTFPLRSSMKQDEINRRVRWCVNVALALRKVHLWSAERICDTMPLALLTYLRDGVWTPPPNEHRIW